MRNVRRTRLVAVVLLLTAFTLITLDYRAGKGSPFDKVRTAVSAVFGPVERALASGFRPVGDAFSSIAHLGSYKARVHRLEKENADLQYRLHLQDAQQTELASMEGLLHLAGKGQFRIVAARVVALGSAVGFEWTATIDAGSHDGIRTDTTVIDGDGLVGRVVRVGPTTSTVLLARDSQSYVGARLAGSGEVGHVQGGGEEPMTFTLLNSHAKLAVGQQLVTWGSEGDRPYVPEVPIGTITKVQTTPGALTRTALVRPFVDYTALDVVGVVVAPPRTVKRDSLLPTPPPGPSPSPTRAPSPAASPSGGPSPSPSRSP